MMSYRARLYLAFSATALLALLIGGVHLFSSWYFREVEEQTHRQERMVLLGLELLEANQGLHSFVHDCINNYRPECKSDYDTALVQHERMLDELTRNEHVASSFQELETLRAKIALTTDVEKRVLARSARDDIRGAEKLFDQAYAAQQKDIQHQIQTFQSVEAQEALAARGAAQRQTRILDTLVWVATGATLLLAVLFVLHFGKTLARPVEMLAASEARYASLFESSRDALMTLAPPSWRFTGANHAAVQLLGAASVAKLTSLGPWDISPERQPDGRLSSEKAQEVIAIAMREGSHFFEWELRRLNGEPFTGDVLLTRMQAGADLYLQATVRDISQRKRVETELRLFRSLLDQSQDGIHVTDPVSARFLDVNDAVCRELGYTRDELLTMTAFDISVGYDRSMFEASVSECKTKGHVTVLAVNRRKDGSTFPVEVRMSYISLDRDYLLATTHDITARMRADAEKELLLKRLDEFATHDPLTGVCNRRQFDATLAREVARAHRYHLPLAIVMFDIDHFKRVNDNHGHQVGDDLLVALSVYVVANVRNNDMLAHWGGEEFILIAPHTDLPTAARLAEKLRALIESGDFGAVGSITCSFGVTQLRDGDTIEDITARADTAMYRAKQAGRNRVECCEALANSVGERVFR